MLGLYSDSYNKAKGVIEINMGFLNYCAPYPGNERSAQRPWRIELVNICGNRVGQEFSSIYYIRNQ
jgi:hypothetical protein